MSWLGEILSLPIKIVNIPAKIVNELSGGEIPIDEPLDALAKAVEDVGDKINE